MSASCGAPLAPQMPFDTVAMGQRGADPADDIELSRNFREMRGFIAVLECAYARKQLWNLLNASAASLHSDLQEQSAVKGKHDEAQNDPREAMNEVGKKQWRGYAAAVGIPIALAALFSLTAGADLELLMLLLILAPIIASRYGVLPGLAATLVALGSGLALSVDALGRAAPAEDSAWVSLLVFAVVGGTLSVMERLKSRATPGEAPSTSREQHIFGTEQADTLRQLRESEARKSAMINTSLDAIVMMDDDGKVVEFNPAAEEIFGYTREEAVGQTMAELIIPPVYRESHRAGLARYLQSGESRILGRRLELAAIRASGEEFPVELVIGRVSGAVPPLFAGYIRDVTERRKAEEALRESEEKFRNLADNISQLAWMSDAEGNVVWYNQRWLEYTGATAEDIYSGGVRERIHPDYHDAVLKRYGQSLASGEPWEDTFPLRGKDGEYRWFLSLALPIRDVDGDVVRWFGTNTDITQQKELQEELREVAARLSEAHRRKDEFLATLAHELRNPLAPLRTGLEVLEKIKDPIPSPVAEVHGVFERQTQQLVRLVDDLLDISRITQNKLTLTKTTVKLEDVVQIALESAQPLLDAAGHTITVALPEQPVFLSADPQRLAQVIANLLNNAIKYTPGKGHITVKAVQLENEARISVKDSGVGIPAEQLDQIFTMFAQVDRPLEKGYTGLGIGLTLAKSMVEMHDGSIEVTSEGLGHGSEFTVELPLAAEPLTGTSSSNAEEEQVATDKHRILVVDDNIDAAETLSLMLRINEHEVRTADNGEEAIKVAEQFRPNIILMDLGMPKLNGYEAGRYIRSQPWSTDVILVALSGWGREGDKRRTQEAGFDHHLVKPVAMADVQKLLAAH